MAYFWISHIEAPSGAASHAHPSSGTDAVGSSEDRSLSSLHDLVSKVTFDVALRGFQNQDLSPSSALVFPRVRRSPLRDEPVQHLELVSCWKGLSHAQALELTMWERLFKQGLACQIKKHLLQDAAHRLSCYPDSGNHALLVPRMIKLLSSEQPVVMEICMIDLVDDMISQLYSAGRSETTYRDFEWSLSSGSLPNFVFNFVRMQDCLLHAADGPYLMFNLSNLYNVDGLTVFADLQWHLPRITFSALPTQLSHGDMYRITPHFSDASLGASGYSGFSGSRDEITYFVTKSDLPMKWDSPHNCFYAPISKGSKCSSEMIETVISAKIVTEFHDGVRFERISRYRIKLEVDAGHPNSAGTSSGIYARRDSYDPPRARHDSPQSSHTGSLQNHGLPWVPSYTNTPQSKTGRTSSQSRPSHVEPCAGHNLMCNEMSRDDQIIHQGFGLIKLEVAPCPFELSSTSSGSCTSPGKRKALPTADYAASTGGPFALDKFDQRQPHADPKRRKLSRPDALSDLMTADSDDDVLFAHLERITTGPMGSAHSSPPASDPLWANKLGESSKAPKSFPATLASTKQTSFTWRGRKRHSNSTANSSPTEDVFAQTSSSSASSGLLSQEQIQTNYREFEQRKINKEQERAYYTRTIPGFDGVVSPTDVEGKTFEGIFLGDDEDEGEWTEDFDGDAEFDGLSEGVASVCLDDD